MSSIALSFNNVDLVPIDNGDGQVWLTSSELAKAIGYKSSKSITNLYNANAHEFTDSMTLVIESVTKGFGSGNSKKPVRIFSLRGCHLIGMFARTKIAQDFRIWVLNILDAHIANDLNQGYQLGDLQRLSDEVDAEYAIGFSYASGGGKEMNKWKAKKPHLEARKAAIQELMQPLLTGFNDAKLIK